MRLAQVGSRAIPVAGRGAAIREARVAQGIGPPSGIDDFPADYRMPLGNYVRPDPRRCWRPLRPALGRLDAVTGLAGTTSADSRDIGR